MRDRVTAAETRPFLWPWRSTSNYLPTGEGSRPTAVEAGVVAHVAALSSKVFASVASLRATRASFFGLRKPNAPAAQTQWAHGAVTSVLYTLLHQQMFLNCRGVASCD